MHISQKERANAIKTVLLSAAFLFLFVGTANAQKSLVGTISDYWQNNKGTSETIDVKVGAQTYFVHIFNPERRSNPKLTGNVREVGRRVRIYYSRIVPAQGYAGELIATKVIAIR